jgi:hypothetical protein
LNNYTWMSGRDLNTKGKLINMEDFSTETSIDLSVLLFIENLPIEVANFATSKVLMVSNKWK